MALVLVFGIWLRGPTLENGFFSDDISALAMAEDAYAAPRGKLDLFNFTDGTPQDHDLLMRAGLREGYVGRRWRDALAC